MGTSFLDKTISSLPAVWYHNNKGLDLARDIGGNAEWCAIFVTYTMYNTGNKDKLPEEIPGGYYSCSYGADRAKELASKDIGEWHDGDSDYKPKRGDIFFRHHHTGFVIGSNGDYIYTIEGNTTRDDGIYNIQSYVPNDQSFGAGGGTVNTRIRDKSYVELGYYTPDFSDNAITEEKRENSLNTLTRDEESEEYFNSKLNIDNPTKQ